MFWLTKTVDEIEELYPGGEVIVSSGVSPSGTYHMGYLREIIICDSILLELKKRGRKVCHIHFVDDQDGFRKVPKNVPAEYDKYLGKPLCDMPAPDGSDMSYADYLFLDFKDSVERLGVEMEVIRSHEKYRSDFFTKAIEKTLLKISDVKRILEEISGRKINDQWSPIQINEDGYLKKRAFISINTNKKEIVYLDKDGNEKTVSYLGGNVKLDWRLDWPARWWLLGVAVEPFGRDHGTKGGSYDTGSGLITEIFGGRPPYPIRYDFINRAGQTKKMSASDGTGISIADVVSMLPAEIVRYFVLRSAPQKTLFFDESETVAKLIDEYSVLLSEKNKTEDQKLLLKICSINNSHPTISSVPFSHLVASYQAALKDKNKTLEAISRTEYVDIVKRESDTIKTELDFIDNWLENWAPEDMKFELKSKVSKSDFNDMEIKFLTDLAEKIESGPEDADGEWFHKAIYNFKNDDLTPKMLFQTIYKALIGKDKGPRAGWFLSILPRDWLIKRLKLIQ